MYTAWSSESLEHLWLHWQLQNFDQVCITAMCANITVTWWIQHAFNSLNNSFNSIFWNYDNARQVPISDVNQTIVIIIIRIMLCVHLIVYRMDYTSLTWRGTNKYSIVHEPPPCEGGVMMCVHHCVHISLSLLLCTKSPKQLHLWQQLNIILVLLYPSLNGNFATCTMHLSYLLFMWTKP